MRQVRISASAGLVSTFAAVYEPFSSSDAVPAPILESVRVLGDGALEVRRRSGEIDLFLSQDGVYETAYGVLEFDGDFAYVSGTGAQSFRAETVGCNALRLDGRSVDLGIDEFVATVVSVDPEAGRVILDSEPPEAVEGLVAVFSNPAYSRTTAYHVRESDGPRLALEASSLVLGVGRVAAVTGPKTMLSDIPHEYAKSVRRISSRFFDGKVLKGEGGGTTRTVAATPGSPIELSVEDASVFRTGERFQYLDIAPADRVRIAFLAVASLHT